MFVQMSPIGIVRETLGILLTDCSLRDCITAKAYRYGQEASRFKQNAQYSMSDSTLRTLRDETDWTDALSHSVEEPVVVFKHSSACSVSGRADQEIRALADEVDLPIYKVVVQENRALSDMIEERLGVRHETPQAIILSDRSSAFDTSHFDVTVETLREALESVADFA